MINFRVAEHSQMNAPMVEVWRDGEFIAAIYGHDKGVRVMSKYFDGVCYEEAETISVIVRLSSGER